MKRTLTTTLAVFFLAASLHAHEVLGTVEIILKGEKKKSDLSNVIVYLDQIQSDVKLTQNELNKKFEMSTKNKQFSPRLLAVPVGATVNFPNFDPIFHNLFSVSRPNDFDLGLYKGGASKSKTFETAGIVRVFCNVHPQMTATIVVSNSPFYTTTDTQGNFTLGVIPWGSFNLRAFSEEGQASQRIDVKDKPIRVNMTIDGRSYKKIKHKNKFGKDYAGEDERY
jgi:plastocyanin